MAIKLADTARPNNYVDSEHLGTFPVAYAEDVWFADGTRLSEKTFDGQSIQKEELPFASATEEGHVYQYIGLSGTYEHGCFYECVNDGDSDYEWKELRVIKNAVVYTNAEPTIGAYAEGSVIVYSGESTNAYKKGHHYKYVVGEPHTLNLFTGENVTIHATTYLRVLEDELVVGAHTYNEAGDNSGYIISVGEDSVEYYSYYYSQVMTVTNIQKGASSTINITDYLDIGGGSGESNTLYADNPIGSIVPYGGVTAPNGWLICQGQAVSRTEYAELFNVIGTNYGGSGSTFNLPNLTQLKQDYTVKTQLDTWRNSLEDGSESHSFTIDKDGSYYFEVVLSNATGGKQSNNITITGNSNLVCSWGFVGSNAILQNKTIFLKAGTYVITHLCETAGIGGTAVVTVYSTRNVPVGSYIIKAKHTPVPADFMAAVDEAVETKLGIKNIALTKVNVESNSGAWASRSGRVVNVDLAALVTLNQTTPSGTILFAGLPKPALNIVRFGVFDAQTIDVVTGLVQINSAGNLVADGQGLKPSTAYWGSFTYLTNE